MGNIDIFNSMADHYDSPSREAVNAALIAALKHRINPNDRLLDFGCGTGLIGLSAIDTVEHVTFCDPSQAMVDQVQLKLAQLSDSQRAKADLVTTNIEVPGSQFPQKYSLIVAAQVLLHIADTSEAIRALAHALSAGGRLVIFDYLATSEVSHPTVHPGFDPDELTILAQSCGLTFRNFEPVYSSDNLLMGKPATLFVMEFCAQD